jgi:hypothetical protein
MRNGFLGSLGTLLAGTGLAFAQPAPPPPAPPPPAAAPKLEILSAPGAVSGTPPASESAAPQSASGAHAAPQTIPLMSGPDAGMPPSPYEKPYCGEVDCEREFDFWVGGEFLQWQSKKAPAPIPLITTGPPGSLGVLGANGVTVKFGGSEIDYNDWQGGRLTFGVGVPGLGVGLESTSLWLPERSVKFLASSDAAGNPTLARPVINSNTGAETSSLIASPGAFSGRATIEATHDLWGTELNIVRGVCATDCLSADWVAGFRYLGLEESLSISQSSTVLAGGTSGFNGDIVLAGSTITIGDVVQTRNEFYGGQVGAQAELCWHGLFVYGLAKVALGDMHETINLAGGSTRTSPNIAGTQAVPGGLLVLRSNTGITSRDVFAVMPEANVNFGYTIGKHFRLYAGYTFLWINDVMRPGDQLNRQVNPTEIPTSLAFGPQVGAPRPVLDAKHTDYWAQGWNFGLVVRY